MSRERLPPRRVSVTDSIRWPVSDGRRIHVTAGFSADGRVLEVFLRGGGKVGSDRDNLLDDAAVILSRALQHGDALRALAAGVGRTPDGAPTSLIGVVLDRLIEIEQPSTDPRAA